jgi:hypothetical protein
MSFESRISEWKQIQNLEYENAWLKKQIGYLREEYARQKEQTVKSISEQLEEAKADICDNYCKYSEWTDDEERFMGIYENCPLSDCRRKAIEQTRWIPCSEQEPTTSDEYLVTWTGEWCGKLGRLIDIVEYDSQRNEWCKTETMCSYEKGKVVAWMPLPEPYNAESEDGNENNNIHL